MKDASDEGYLDVGRQALALCRRYGATFIVDDRVEAAAELGADGVHLGKNDMPVEEARRRLGSAFIIGATANTFDDIRAANRAGADYIGLGPFRFTTTKKNLSPVLGLEGYRDIMTPCRTEGITLPVTAIGGILTDDIPVIMGTGVHGVAVSGLILNSPSPEKTTQQIITTLDKWKN
jgi:thiamine-phosphate diphosphorylase